MTFIPFHPAHILSLDVHPNVTQELQISLVGAGRKLQERGPCLTLVNGRIMACGGLAFLKDREAEVWVIMDKNAGPHVHKALKEQFHRWIKNYDLKRVQATVQKRWQEDNKYAEWMGMKCEEEIASFSGLEQLRYAWVKE